MSYVLVCIVALFASGLTFFTGFGLGTLLLPAFSLFFAVETAVALTAVVHLLNGLFKVALVGRRADFSVALRFGLPALIAAFAGAQLLVWIAGLPAIVSYSVGGRVFDVAPVKLAIALLMALFAAMEVVPYFKRWSVPPKYLPLGGLFTGFFGGLSGHQGALRSVFLLRAGLSKEAFVATGAVISLGIDVSRLTVYAKRILALDLLTHGPLVVAATLAAFAGAFAGNRLLSKIRMRTIEIAVAVLLIVVAAGLASGLL